jgi:hypothetical protein
VPLEHLTWCLPFLITLCPLAKWNEQQRLFYQPWWCTYFRTHWLKWKVWNVVNF